MNQDLKQYAQLRDENIELKKEIERLKGEIKDMSQDLLICFKMINESRRNFTERTLLENLKNKQRERLKLLTA